MLVNPDDTGPAPFPDLCRSSPNAPARADHEQGLAGSELSIFNQAEPSGEVSHTYRRRLLEGQRLGLAPKARDWDGNQFRMRSEEHTSELQSLAYLVCRLLLEKKKFTMDYVYLIQHIVTC